MPSLERKVEVCDFCYSFHQYYMPDQPFNFGKKEGVATCTLCKDHNVICRDCFEHSSMELQNSVLFQFWIVICRDCLVNVRRLTDTQERLEVIAQKRIEQVKESLRENAYILTQSLQWQL